MAPGPGKGPPGPATNSHGRARPDWYSSKDLITPCPLKGELTPSGIDLASGRVVKVFVAAGAGAKAGAAGAKAGVPDPHGSVFDASLKA